MIKFNLNFKKLKDNLYEVEGKRVFLYINTSRSTKLCKQSYYRFGSLKLADNMDFYVFACEKTCYIVPAEEMGSKKSVYIPARDKHKYCPYKEKWQYFFTKNCKGIRNDRRESN